MSDTDKLNRLLSQVEKLKAAKDNAEGQKKVLLQHLQDEFEVGSVSEGVAKYKSLTRNILKEEAEIESAIYELEELLHDID